MPGASVSSSASPAGGVKAATYDQIKNGMTLAEVQLLLGSPGVKQGGSDDGHGHGFAVIDWTTDPPGTGIIVTFIEGVVTDKASVGF